MPNDQKISALAITDLCDEPESARLEREAREREARNAKITTEFSGVIDTIEKNDHGYWVTIKHKAKEYGAQCVAEGWTPKKGDTVNFKRLPEGHDRSTLIITLA